MNDQRRLSKICV
jgi:hypothetical protein